MSDPVVHVIAGYVAVCVIATTIALVVWVWEHWPRFWPWFRRWNPIYLRAEIDFLSAWLNDDRNHFADDSTNTLVEQTYRRLRLISDGHISPVNEAARYTVKDGTLHIDATSHPTGNVANDDTDSRRLGAE